MNRRDLLLNGFKMMVITGLLPQFTSCLRKLDDKAYFFPHHKDDFNFIQINLYGGPVRWMFDNFLKPSDKHEFMASKMVGNKFKDESGGVRLEQVVKHGYTIPSFWSEKWKNGREVSSLLENMITIRGVDVNVAGHPLGNIKMVRPDSTKNSLHGTISDHSKTPLPSIILGSNPASRSFHSKKRNGIIIPLNENSLMETILSPFILAEKKSLFGKTNRKDAILKEAFSNLSDVLGAEDQYLTQLKGSLRLFVDNLDDFLYEYDLLVSKYQKLVKENIHQYAGLDMDKLALSGLNNNQFKKKLKEEDWGRYKIDYQTYLRGDNLEEMLSSADLGHLPHQFAAAEFLIKRGLSNSFMLSTPNEMGHFIYNCENKGNIYGKSFMAGKEVLVKEARISIAMDSHDTGTILQTIGSFMFFRGLTSCLDELKRSLKQMSVGDKSLFDRTIIQICSEFERLPREDEGGSDHNNHSHTSSFISGSIKKFEIVGNIKVGNEEMGTIGTAGEIGKFGRNLSLDDIYHSVCEVMQVPSPMARAEGLLKWDKGNITASFSELRNIEGKSS